MTIKILRSLQGARESCSNAGRGQQRLVPGVAALGLGLVLGFGIQGLGAAEGGEVVARGKGFAVYESELDRLTAEQKVILRGMGRQVTEEEERLLEAQTMDRLVVREILLLMATEQEREEARQVVMRNVAEEKAKLGSEDAYRRQILKGGVTPEDFEARLLDQATADMVISREIRSKVTVSEEAVRRFYEEGVDVPAAGLEAQVAKMVSAGDSSAAYRDATNRLAIIRQTNLDRLVRPEQARARMLVLFTKNPVTGDPLTEDIKQSKRERLERLRRRVLDGEDFGVLATEFSEEPDAQRNRAEYVATRERVTLPRLQQALFSLPLNQLSEVIETDLGYYLVEVLERPPAGKVPFDGAREQIRDLLRNQEVEKRLPAWFEELKREYGLEVLIPAGPS